MGQDEVERAASPRQYNNSGSKKGHDAGEMMSRLSISGDNEGSVNSSTSGHLHGRKNNDVIAPSDSLEVQTPAPRDDMRGQQSSGKKRHNHNNHKSSNGKAQEASKALHSLQASAAGSPKGAATSYESMAVVPFNRVFERATDGYVSWSHFLIRKAKFAMLLSAVESGG